MRVKICGMTRISDVEAAIGFGADAVGFVVGTPSSGRNLTMTEAKKLMKHVPVFNMKVAVTASRSLKALQKISHALRPDALQLHHHTKTIAEELRKHNPEMRLILAAMISNRASVDHAKRATSYSDAIIADTPSDAGRGGTGRTHDWALTALVREGIQPHPLILAGGLTSLNVRSAIRKVKPYAVDVSGGVENMPGVKDHAKMRDFIVNAKKEKST